MKKENDKYFSKNYMTDLYNYITIFLNSNSLNNNNNNSKQ